MIATPSRFRYKCSSCNELHEGLPDVAFSAPDAFEALSPDERMERALIDDDFCIIDGNRYFLRCLAEAPIKGFKESFGWGLWCELDWRPFKRVWELYGFDEPIEPLYSRRGSPMRCAITMKPWGWRARFRCSTTACARTSRLPIPPMC